MAVAKFKKYLGWKPAAAAVLVAGLAAAAYKHKFQKEEPKDEDSSVSVVSKGDLEIRFSELGDIAAKNEIDLASKVGGRVIELFVQEGDIVKKGQKIAVIQPGKTGAERFLPSTLTAPIDGVLLRYVANKSGGNGDAVFVEVGQYITGIFESQNPTYLMTIADMREIIVKLKINEMDILKLREKMPVTVIVDALPDEKFDAQVSMIAPQAEKEARGGKYFRVEVSLKENDPRLRTGMTARVDALLEKREDVLKIPLAGLFEEKGRELVYLFIDDEKPRQKAVKTGMRSETEIQILSGIDENTKILIEKPEKYEKLPKEDKKDAHETADRKEAKKAQRKARKMKRAVN